MKTLILTAALTVSTLFALAQTTPVQRPKQVIRIDKVFPCYERFATGAQRKTADSLKVKGFKPFDSYRIAGTRNMKVTFVKFIY